MRVRLGVALLLVGLVLAGCGAGDPSGGNPAPLAPANSLIYLQLTLRPQGTQRTAAEDALTRLLGHSPDAAIQRFVGRVFRRAGLSYGSDVAPWLGQQVGIVVTKFSRDGLGLIAPTNATSAALKTFRRALHVPLQSASYSGIHYQECVDASGRLALGAVGQNAVLAAPAVFKEIVDAFHGQNSLATTAAFGSAFSAVPGTPLIKAYVNATGLGGALRTLLGALPSGGPNASIRQLFGTALAKLHGTLGVSLTAAAHALTLDVRSSNVHRGHGGDVGSLPEQSWLALATGALNLKPLEHVLNAQVGQNPAMQLALSGLRAKLGLSLLHDILPALGPLELSFQGTSALAVAGGLVMRPSDLAAAGRVLTAIHRLVSRSASLSVQGTAHSFTITRRGLPIPRVVVTQTGGKVVVTLDESPAQALAPPTHLSASPRLATARARLAPGSLVPLFIDFRGIGQLLQGLSGVVGMTHAQGIIGVLGRLDYLVVGSSPTQGDLRVVLALR